MNDLAAQLAKRPIAGVLAPHPPWLPGYGLVIEVSAGSGGSLGPLHEIRRRLEQQRPGTLLDASRRLRGGLRKRLLGEPDADAAESVVQGINEAVHALDRSVLVILDGAERTDLETVSALIRAASLPGWLHLSVLLVFHALPEVSAPQAELARAVGVEIPREGPSAGPPDPGEVETGEKPVPADPKPTFDPGDGDGDEYGRAQPLDPTVQVTLRAAALRGPTFDVAEIAQMQGISEVAVLERLQAAVEAGWPLMDLGRGKLAMPTPVAERLKAGILPSLQAAWRARLTQPAQPAAPSQAPARASASPERAPAPGVDVQISELAAAARRALDGGDPSAARQMCAQALVRLEASPKQDEASRRLGVELLCLLATAAQRGAGEKAALLDAAALAERARSRLTEASPPALVATVFATLASIRHDLGDETSLQEAASLLGEAMTLLRSAGDSSGAARLINDQAAVWVRLGDLRRASELLRASREIFARNPGDPIARRELAETDHLIARLPLHASADPQQLEAALESAKSAEAALRALGLPHDLGRVLETEGRLLLGLGKVDEAIGTLQQAGALQQRLGDALGLAMTAASISDALRAAHRDGDALALLADSIGLNTRAGSRLGLAHNRRALDRISARGAPDAPGGLGQAAEALRKRIDDAEQMLGQLGTRLPA